LGPGTVYLSGGLAVGVFGVSGMGPEQSQGMGPELFGVLSGMAEWESVVLAPVHESGFSWDLDVGLGEVEA
jgi:hypothetical protein